MMHTCCCSNCTVRNLADIWITGLALQVQNKSLVRTFSCLHRIVLQFSAVSPDPEVYICVYRGVLKPAEPMIAIPLLNCRELFTGYIAIAEHITAIFLTLI